MGLLAPPPPPPSPSGRRRRGARTAAAAAAWGACPRPPQRRGRPWPSSRCRALGTWLRRRRARRWLPPLRPLWRGLPRAARSGPEPRQSSKVRSSSGGRSTRQAASRRRRAAPGSSRRRLRSWGWAGLGSRRSRRRPCVPRCTAATTQPSSRQAGCFRGRTGSWAGSWGGRWTCCTWHGASGT